MELPGRLNKGLGNRYKGSINRLVVRPLSGTL